MLTKSDIDIVADAFGEDELGPLFTKPLVIETDIEQAVREEQEWEAVQYAAWAESFSAWERDWWEREQDQ